jgi:hypothetical protein
MKVGQRSLLYGVHQFLWHPITVLIAWWVLFGRPTWRELVCIIIHDWGYWNCPNMDGPEGNGIRSMPRSWLGSGWARNITTSAFIAPGTTPGTPAASPLNFAGRTS